MGKQGFASHFFNLTINKEDHGGQGAYHYR